MTGHTKEPWGLDETDPGTYEIFGNRTGFCADVVVMARFDNPDDPARIVACVNALATIPDPQAFMEAARGMREALGAISDAVSRDDGIVVSPDVDGALAAGIDAIETFDAAQGEQ